MNWRGTWLLEEGVRWRPPPENFEILSPRKRDFRYSEANSACFNVSFFKNGSNLVMGF